MQPRVIRLVPALLLVGAVLAATGSNLCPTEWDVLGPFALDTQRERGADTLRAFGGIFAVERGGSQTFPSEVVNGGAAPWQQFAGLVIDDQVNVLVGWPDADDANQTSVDWDLLEGWGGEALSEWKGWALGTVVVAESGTYAILIGQQARFFVDGPQRMFFGDTYGHARMWQPLWLAAGSHTLFVELMGSGPQNFTCQLAAWASLAGNRSSSGPEASALFSNLEVIVPDIVDGTLAAPFVGLTVTSAAAVNVSVSVVAAACADCWAIVDRGAVSVQPGQICPLVVELEQFRVVSACGDTNTTWIGFALTGGHSVITQNVTLSCRSWGTAYSFTFLDGAM